MEEGAEGTVVGLGRRRMSPARLAGVRDADLRAAWARVRADAERLLRPREAALAVTYLWNYVAVYHAVAAEDRRRLAGSADAGAIGGGGVAVHDAADLRLLDGTRAGADRARRAWHRLVAECGLRGRYLERVQGLLAHALALVVESLAAVVNPGRRRHRLALERLTGVRSACARFTLFECLPLAVRRLDPRDPHHGLLLELGHRLAEELRTVSRGHLQKSLLFLDRLLRPRPPVDLAGCADGPAALAALATVDAAGWLAHYERCTRDDAPVSPPHFRRQLRLLHLLHGRLLPPPPVSGGGAATTTTPLRIPLAAATAVGAAAPGGWTAATSTTADEPASSSSFGTTGSSERDESLRRDLRALKLRVADLRRRRCAPAANGAATAPEDAAFAFRPAEVRAIVVAASTTFERLVVLLFLTTGLRLAGVCRLPFPALPAGCDPRAAWGRDVPRELVTTEKHGARRRVFLTPAVRILVARWLREECPLVDGVAQRWLLQRPARAHRNEPLSTGHLWSVCRGVFRRARLAGPHVHPHTFRHTLVHLMYVSGNSFEKIAKFLGHASPAVTSAVYGRLRHLDALSGVRGVPFLASDEARDNRDAWAEVGRLLRDPWRASAPEWEGLSPAEPEAEPCQSRRAQLVRQSHQDRAAAAGTSVGRPRD